MSSLSSMITGMVERCVTAMGLVSSGELDRRLNASMGSGRGDRNQVFPDTWDELQAR